MKRYSFSEEINLPIKKNPKPISVTLIGGRNYGVRFEKYNKKITDKSIIEIVGEESSHEIISDPNARVFWRNFVENPEEYDLRAVAFAAYTPQELTEKQLNELEISLIFRIVPKDNQKNYSLFQVSYNRKPRLKNIFKIEKLSEEQYE